MPTPKKPRKKSAPINPAVPARAEQAATPAHEREGMAVLTRPDLLLQRLEAHIERHLDAEFGVYENGITTTTAGGSELAGQRASTVESDEPDAAPRLPWAKDSNFVPRTIRGRLASELMLDPAIREPLFHVAPRMAVARRLTLLIGREKSGKSTLAAYCASQVSKGDELLGGETCQARVLWVGLEEPVGDALTRFEKMGADMRRVSIIDRFTDASVAEAIAKEIEAFGPAFVVVDSLAILARAHGLAEKSEEGWTELLTVLRHAAQDAGCAVILLHHARKSDGEFRGSTAIAAAADQIVTISEVDSDPMVRRVVAKGRWMIPNYAVRFDPDSLSYSVIDGNVAKAEHEDNQANRMLDLLRNKPGAGKTLICDSMGMQGTRARKLFERLFDEGRITNVLGGRGYMVSASGDCEDGQLEMQVA